MNGQVINEVRQKAMYGYNGKMLIVDLTARLSHWEAISEDVFRKFIGGSGLGAYFLYKFCPTGIDALEPANPLIFVTSPLVGSRLTTSSKFAVITKSPLTGFIGDSLSSSFMATELKRTGCDALVIIGKSDSPCLLSINDGQVEFLEADDLMGLYQTMDIEKAKLLTFDTAGYIELNEALSTIICTRDKDLRQCPGWHYGWEIGRQAQFGPELVDKQGQIMLDKSGSSPKIKGTGLSFFYAQCLTGDAVDNIPGLPQCGPVKAYHLLHGLGGTPFGHEAMLSIVIQEYQKKYKSDWEKKLLEQGRLLWMVRRINNDGTPVMWNIGDTS